MTLHEILVLAGIISASLGSLCALYAAAIGSSRVMILYAFMCWPLVAYYGLVLLMKRMRGN